MVNDTKVKNLRGTLFETGDHIGMFSFLVKTASNGQAFKNIYREIYHKYTNIVNPTDIGETARRYKDNISNDLTYIQAVDQMTEAAVTGEHNIASWLLSLHNSKVSTLDSNIYKYFDYDIICANMALYAFDKNLYSFDKKESRYCFEDGPLSQRTGEMLMELFHRQITELGGATYDMLRQDDPGEMFGKVGRGQFMNADALVLVRYRSKGKEKYALFVADESCYVSDEKVIAETPEDIYTQIENIAYDVRSKSILKKTDVDAGNSYDGIDINRAIQLAAGEKELAKASQAASYAKDFCDWLTRTGYMRYTLSETENRIPDISRVTCAGITNTDIGIVNIKGKADGINKTELDCFSNEYKNRYTNQTYKDARVKSLQEYNHSLVEKFGTRVIDRDKDWYRYELRLVAGKDFYNTCTLRKEHAAAVIEALGNDLFLELDLFGTPGIGKTTAFSTYLTQNKENDIIIYTSPRTAVNYAFQNGLLVNASEYLNVSSDTSQGENTVLVLTEDPKHPSKDAIRAKALGEEIGIKVEYIRGDKEYNTTKILSAKTDHTGVMERGNQKTPVLKTLASFVEALRRDEEKTKSGAFAHIAVTVSTQACGKCGEDNRKRYFKQMLGFINDNDKEKNTDNFLRAHSRIMIMVDEVSGDAKGAEVAASMKEYLANIHDASKGRIRVKLILADASIMDMRTSKIFLRGNIGERLFCGNPSTQDGAANNKVIIDENMSAKESRTRVRFPCRMINANGFSAKELYCRYHVSDGINIKTNCIEKIERDAVEKILSGRKLVNIGSSDKPTMKREQILIFIQNRNDLNKLEAKFEKNGIKTVTIYSDTDREKLKTSVKDTCDDSVAAWLVTSSASRGLSFPLVTKLFIVVPTFNFPTNAMEIMQAIFRGRGTAYDEERITELDFYIDLSREIKKTETNAEYRYEKKLQNKIDAAAIQLLIQSLIETRVCGYDKHFMKAITALGMQRSGNIEIESQYAAMQKSIDVLSPLARNSAAMQEFISVADGLHGYKIADEKANTYRNFMETKRLEYNKCERTSAYIPFAVMNGLIIFRAPNGTQIEREYSEETLQDSVKWNAFAHKYHHDVKVIAKQQAKYRTAAGIIFKILSELHREFDKNVNIIESTSDHYLAFPLASLNRKWGEEAEKWGEMACEEEPKDIVAAMYSVLNANVHVNSYVPTSAAKGFVDHPYLFFSSSDIKEKNKSKFTASQLFASNSTTVLSLIFKAKEEKKAAVKESTQAEAVQIFEDYSHQLTLPF